MVPSLSKERLHFFSNPVFQVPKEWLTILDKPNHTSLDFFFFYCCCFLFFFFFFYLHRINAGLHNLYFPLLIFPLSAGSSRPSLAALSMINRVCCSCCPPCIQKSVVCFVLKDNTDKKEGLQGILINKSLVGWLVLCFFSSFYFFLFI